MRFESGQPEWQNGTPHSMQRPACRRSSASGSVPTNSRRSRMRSRGSRSGGSRRGASMKPRSLPTTSAPSDMTGAWHGDWIAASRCGLGLADEAADAARRPGVLAELVERAPEVVRHHLYEAVRVPRRQHACRDGRARPLAVLGDERPHELLVLRLERLEADELRVAARGEGAVLVEDVGEAAAHPGGEVASRRAEHDHAAAGHVLAAVVADALDDGARARVAHGEPLAREPAEERAAGGRAVEDGVADDHVLLG